MIYDHSDLLESYYEFLNEESYINEIKNIEITGDRVKSLFVIIDYFYRKYSNIEKTSSVKRMLNAIKCNEIQRKYLTSTESVSYLKHTDPVFVDGKLDFLEKTISTDQFEWSSLDPKKRSIVIYSRWDGEDHHVTPFVYCIFYYVIDKLISEGKTKIFTDLKFVTDLSQMVPPQLTSTFGESKVSRPKGIKFIEETCVYSNTIHFHGGELPDSFLGTIPILCDSFVIQNSYIGKIKNYINIPLFFYNVKLRDGFVEIEDDDFELCIDNNLKSYKQYFDSSKEINENSKSIEKIVSTIIDTIKKVEDRLLLDDIYRNDS